MELLTTLRQCPPFSDLSEEILTFFSQTFKPVKYQPGETIIRQNELVEKAGIISSGRAELIFANLDGQRAVFQTIGCCEFFGIIALFTDGNSMVSVECSEPVQCWVTNFRMFKSIIMSLPQIRDHFYQTAFKRIWDAYRVMNSNRAQFSDRQNIVQAVSTRIDRSVLYINQNYKLPLTLENVARESGISRYHFSRLFKIETGFSFKEYLNFKRINAAKRLLRDNDLNVSEVCFAIGYNDLSYFSRVFRKHTGLAPSKFRESHKNNL